MKRVSYLLLAVAYLSLLSVKTYSQIKVDGLFFDWLPKYQLDVSPNEEKTFADGDETVPARGGTNAAYFADLDIDDLYATDDANFVYLRIKMNSIGNILNVPNDTSYHGGAALAVYISVDPGEGDTTGLTWGWWGNGYDYLIQAFPSDSLAENTTMYPQYIYEHKQTGNGWDYEIASPTLGAQVVWNSTNNDVEIAIPKSILLHPRNIANFAGTDKIAIMVYAGENNAPWRADYCSTPGIGGFLLNLKPEGKVAIDGNFFDWQQDTQLDLGDNAEKTFADGDETEPARGSSEPSYYADLDIDDVFATDDEDNVYVRIKMNSIADVSRIAADTSYHGGAAIAAYISIDPGTADTTGLTWGWWGNGYDYFVQVYPADSAYYANTGFEQALWEHNQTGNGWDYVVADDYVGVKAAWNASNNEVEMAIPKSLLLNPKNMPNFTTTDKIAIMIYAGENNGPWRADYASMSGVGGFIFNLDPGTGIAEEYTEAIPTDINLAQNYPNPFNPTTKIEYTLPKEGFVKLRVFNMIGEEVATLVNSMQNQGRYSVNFNASNLASGIYLYSLEAGSAKIVKKMLLLK